ncbi:hypothetical protein [Ostreibacterium oceani]|uniref:Uncharacterized protein n=1 Tax=Ostreibacterium oceani TaxID=2654998 RepID=A0A6N7EYB0_9GAMM|nr:hypothetical protein [Ostreibacterium oceani]MPV86369.1 hypothetical protein [Ostreibacterium oceani]
MKLELNEQETQTLIEMLTMSGYILTQASDNAISKAENMHELIQKIYQQAQSSSMPESFDQDDATDMIFPNADIMSGSEDSPLYLLKSYNEYAAADVLSQQLSLRDASEKHGMPQPSESGEFDPAFIDTFIARQNDYLDEFSQNGFNNVKVSRIQLS